MAVSVSEACTWCMRACHAASQRACTSWSVRVCARHILPVLERARYGQFLGVRVILNLYLRLFTDAAGLHPEVWHPRQGGAFAVKAAFWWKLAAGLLILRQMETPVSAMEEAEGCRSSRLPCSMRTSVVWSGQIPFLSGSYLRGKDCSRWSVIWLPVQQGHCSAVWPVRRLG